MIDFDFVSPTKIYFGNNKEELIGQICSQGGYKRVYIVIGQGSVKRNGLLSRVTESLDKEGIKYQILEGVRPNPTIDLCHKGIEEARIFAPNLILAIGGGSVIDTAKNIAVGYFYSGNSFDFNLHIAKPKKALPIGVILTIAASGSEMSNSCVIQDDEKQIKMGFNDDIVRPVFAIENPKLTYSVSRVQTAYGIVDIMMHTFERYFHQGYALDITDELSYALIRSVIKWTPVALETPDDYDARANLMWAGSISHNGLMEAGNANPGDWGCHQMEHEISAEYDVAHGAGLAAIWGSWARYVLPEGPERFSALGEAVFGESDPVKTIEKFEEFFHSIGMPTDIKGLGLNFDEAACRKVALGTTFNDGRTIGNFKVLGTEDVFNIMMMASGLK